VLNVRGQGRLLANETKIKGVRGSPAGRLFVRKKRTISSPIGPAATLGGGASLNKSCSCRIRRKTALPVYFAAKSSEDMLKFANLRNLSISASVIGSLITAIEEICERAMLDSIDHALDLMVLMVLASSMEFRSFLR
jgi:hypothetical protein